MSDNVPRREFMVVVAGVFATLALPTSRFRRPVEKIHPYLVQPETTVPGVANWYASTCRACPAGCGALVKVLDGRPIKLEGNPTHPVSSGGLCARGQASLLDLYDSERFTKPRLDGVDATWEAIDAEVAAKLREVSASGRAIVVVTRTASGPTRQHALAAFASAFPNVRLVIADPVPGSAILDAYERTHGARLLPAYAFQSARAVTSFDADFLGAWISPVEFTQAWSKARRLDAAWLGAVEGRLSLTGANADLRIPLVPSRQLDAVSEVARRVAAKLGRTLKVELPSLREPLDVPGLEEIANRLVAAAPRALVVSGSRSIDVQVVINALNEVLGAEGVTLDLAAPSHQLRGRDADLDALIADMAAGRVGALIVLDANPAYDHARATEFATAMGNVPLTLSLATRGDETAARCRVLAPDHHPLESWDDHEPRAGVVSIVQPVIRPLFGTRSAIESLLVWAGKSATAYDTVRAVWREKLFPRQKGWANFDAFWDAALQGGFETDSAEKVQAPPFMAGLRVAPEPAPVEGGFELDLFASVALFDGRQANNPWLQELPDPVTKVTWGNVASMSPATAKQLGVVEGRLVELSAGAVRASLPTHIQLGMPDGVIASALGYGRPSAGRIAANYPTEKFLPVAREEGGGANLYPFLRTPRVNVTPGAGMSRLAKSQEYDFSTMPLTGQQRGPGQHAGREHAEKLETSLWPKHEYKGHKWGLAIDLNACTGCSGCVIGCQAENNIPVVGKSEIRKGRDLHWIRLDRYYSGSESAPEPNPTVSFQPMLCQQCDNAPCETVCPVLATVHSSDGLNMQVYNRCVGTRYCANNCPYKVRRFNWFDYARQNAVQNLVLNPQVTVRTRGVMEKCTFCVQRIYDARSRAKGEGRPIRDGDIQPACAQSCPAQAIVFGDLNDPTSRVSRMAREPRRYRVLEEIGTEPAVFYLCRSHGL